MFFFIANAVIKPQANNKWKHQKASIHKDKLALANLNELR